MEPAKRIRMSLLIEKMNKQKEYSELLGLEERSRLHGKQVKKEKV